MQLHMQLNMYNIVVAVSFMSIFFDQFKANVS